MNTHASFLVEQRINEWTVQQRIAREMERRDAQPKAIPERSIVTISRAYGAGGHSVAQLVADQLGGEWTIWDREIVDAVAENAKVRKEMVERFDEQTHSVIEQIVRYTTNGWTLAPDRYRQHLIEVLVSIAHAGKAVIVGRGANYVLKDAFKVRLIASQDYRVHMIEQREHQTHPDAVAKLRKTDHERADFIRATFGRDLENPNGYDMVLRMDNLDVETASAAIVAGLKQHMRPVDASDPRLAFAPAPRSEAAVHA